MTPTYITKTSNLRSLSGLLILLLLSLFYGTSRAQTGPGGVGNNTTNVLWLDASNQTVTSGTTWTDRSGNGNNFSNTARTGSGATYVTNAQNNKPAFEFNGSSNYFDRAYSAALNPANISIIAVTRVDASNDFKSLITSRTNSTPGGQGRTKGYIIYAADNENWQFWYGENNGNNGFNNNNVTNVSTAGAWSITTFTCSPTALNYYINNNTAVNFAVTYAPVNGAAPGPTTTYPVRLGAGAPDEDAINGGAPQFFFDGRIAEFIMYNTVLTDVQRIILNNVLAWKYNITLSNNNTYPIRLADATTRNTYSYDVAGIGQSGGVAVNDSQGSGIVRINNTTTSLANNEYMFWGHDNGALSATTNDLPTAVTTVKRRLARKWVVFERSNTSATGIDIGTTTISIDLSQVPGPKAAASDLVLLLDRDGDGFSDEGTTSVITASSLVGSTVTFTGVNLGDGFRFTVGTVDPANTPLPITLNDFTATVENRKRVKLAWGTSMEENNDYFSLQRSYDGVEWTELTKVPGAGTTSETRYYSYYDEKPYAGRSYYRLKQVDYNGTEHDADIVAAYLPDELKVYPIPANEALFVELSSDTEVNTTIPAQFINAQGAINEVIPEPVDTRTLRLGTDHLAPGMYLLRMGELTKKVLIE